ncbi:MAG: hypothetical protein ACI9Y7_000169 [Dokdonia sp.]|jgi:hypothetical protein
MRLLLLFLSFFILVSCSNNESDNAGWEPKNASGSYDGSTSFGFTTSFEDEDGIGNTIVDLKTPPPNQTTTQKIIKTGNLRFETQELKKTHQKILAAVQKANGYVQRDNTGKNNNSQYHNLTVRVPSENFDTVIQAISDGVAYFEEKTISQRDVTEEFVDLNARLKAKRTLEKRYLELLSKAKNVKEMLEIERELSKIREEIEAREGRLQYLQSQVSESTITIYFYKISSERGVTVSYGRKVSNAFKNGWSNISEFFLGLLHIWPFIILVAISIFMIRRWIKKRKKK